MHFHFKAIIALTWILVSIIITCIIYDDLGFRGWVFLSMHHIFCMIGAGTELKNHFSEHRLNRK